jgi:molecular chaperone GrpE
MSDRRDDGEVKVIDRRWWAQQAEGAESAPAGDDAAWRPGKPTYVEELEARLAEKDRQLQETLAKYRESAREFDETRVRLRKDIGREIERGRRAMLAELLEVIDNLDRAIDAGRAAVPPGDPLLQGVELVRGVFLAKLEGFGVTRVEALGASFDPARHEAVTVVPTTDPDQDGVVCGVLTPGYLAGDEVLRPAVVAVTQVTARSIPPRA